MRFIINKPFIDIPVVIYTFCSSNTWKITFSCSKLETKPIRLYLDLVLSERYPRGKEKQIDKRKNKLTSKIDLSSFSLLRIPLSADTRSNDCLGFNPKKTQKITKKVPRILKKKHPQTQNNPWPSSPKDKSIIRWSSPSSCAAPSSNSQFSRNVSGTWLSKFGFLSCWKRVFSGAKFRASSQLEEVKQKLIESNPSAVAVVPSLGLERFPIGLLKEFWVVISELVWDDLGETFIQLWSNLAMLSVLHAYVVDDWAGSVEGQIG